MIKILLNINISKDSILAQDRTGKTWCQFMNKKKYQISVFCLGEPDPFIANQDNVKIIYLNNDGRLNFFRSFFIHNFGGFQIIISGKKTGDILKQLRFLKFRKFNKLKKILFEISTPKLIFIATILPPYLHSESTLYCLKNADLVLSISSKVKEIIDTMHNVPSRLFPLSYDTQLFSINKNHNSDKKSIICVGSLKLRKQPLLYLNIAKQIPECKFTWVGQGPMLDNILQKKRIEKIYNFSLLNSVPNRELPSIYNKHNIFVFTSLIEGFGNVLIEAMSCGLPCLAFSNWGPEAIIDGKTGFWVDDEWEMVEKIKLLISDYSLYEKMSRASRERAVEYDGRNNIHIFENLIDSVI